MFFADISDIVSSAYLKNVKASDMRSEIRGKFKRRRICINLSEYVCYEIKPPCR